MRHLRMSAVLIFGALAAAHPSCAQVIRETSVEQANRLSENMIFVMARGEKITQLSGAPFSDGRIVEARTAEELLAGIEAALPRIESARADLQRIALEIRALPSLATTTDHPEMRLHDQMRDGVADHADRVEASLATYPLLADAIREGNQKQIVQLIQTGKESVALGYDAQALRARGGAIFAGTDSSAYAQLMASACFSDGLAAYSRGALDLIDEAESTTSISSATTCIRTNLDLTREAMDREAVTIGADPALRETQLAAAAILTRMVEEEEAMIPLLERSSDDLRAGLGVERSVENISAANEILGRLRALAAEEAAIYARR